MSIEEQIKEDVIKHSINGKISGPYYTKVGRFSQYHIRKYFGNFKNLRHQLGLRRERSFEDIFLGLIKVYTGYFVFPEYSFTELINPLTGSKFRFDGFIEELNLLIEYDDISHFKEMQGYSTTLAQRKERDLFKDNFAKEKNINLVRFSYLEDISKDYVLEKIASVINKNDFKERLAVPSQSTGFYGVSFDNTFNAYIATITDNGTKRLISSKDKFLVALYREGYIITHNKNSRLNNLSIESLNDYGVSSWGEIEKLKSLVKLHSSLYHGVCKTGNYFKAYIRGSKTKTIFESKDEKLCALYREGFLINNPEIKAKLNNFSLKDLKDYGIENWKDFELLKRFYRSSQYLGVTLHTSNGESYFRAIICNYGVNRQLIQSKDEKLCALYREGFILSNNLDVSLNNLSLDELKFYGISSWLDYDKLRTFNQKSSYIGVSFNSKESKFFTRVIFLGKRKMLLMDPDDKLCALFREGFIIKNKLDSKLNNFNLEDWKEYGLSGPDEFEKLKKGDS